MLSGRYTVVVASRYHGEGALGIVPRCCSRLGITRSGTETLLHGTEIVPAKARVRDWPGLRRPGE
eukprot:4535178-Amphidinium_carterae.1